MPTAVQLPRIDWFSPQRTEGGWFRGEKGGGRGTSVYFAVIVRPLTTCRRGEDEALLLSERYPMWPIALSHVAKCGSKMSYLPYDI